MKRHYIYPDISKCLLESKHTAENIKTLLQRCPDIYSYHGFLYCSQKMFNHIKTVLIKEGVVAIPSELVDVRPLKKAALVPYVRYTIIYGVAAEENVRITQLIRSKYRLSGWEAIIKEAWRGIEI